jgi:hypothetical protein
MDLTSWTWWTSVVGVGIALNLISAYLKSPIDHLLSRTSTRWSTRTAAKRQAGEQRIALLASDRDRRVDARLHCPALRSEALMFLILGGILHLTDMVTSERLHSPW